MCPAFFLRHCYRKSHSLPFVVVVAISKIDFFLYIVQGMFVFCIFAWLCMGAWIWHVNYNFWFEMNQHRAHCTRIYTIGSKTPGADTKRKAWKIPQARIFYLFMIFLLLLLFGHILMSSTENSIIQWRIEWKLISSSNISSQNIVCTKFNNNFYTCTLYTRILNWNSNVCNEIGIPCILCAGYCINNNDK